MPDIQYNTELGEQERALHYGDGLFETLLQQDGEIPLWQAHMDRLKQGCLRLSITLPETDWLRNEVAQKSKGSVRIRIFRSM